MNREFSELGVLMRAGLKDAGMNQLALAELLGITDGQVSHIIVGRSKPSPPLLLKIVQALNLDQTEALRAYFGSELWDSFITQTAADVHEIMNKQ